jgi:hypothetical protein
MLKIPKYLTLTMMLLLLVSFNTVVNADTLNRQVISAGGGNVTTGNETLIYTFGQPFILPTAGLPLQTGFLFPSGEPLPPLCDTTQEEWICVEFSGLKPVYNIGDHIQIDVNINVKVKRFERVDLWIAIGFPDGSLFFKTDLLANSLVPINQAVAFKDSLETLEITHHLVDLELPPGLGGTFTFYALYVNEGKKPLEEGIDATKRSELLIKQTTLANE